MPLVEVAEELFSGSARREYILFFERYSELCIQFKKVIEILRCKNLSKARESDLGKECSDLGAKWILAGGKDSTLKYYLHTLVHHAGALQTSLLSLDM